MQKCGSMGWGGGGEVCCGGGGYGQTVHIPHIVVRLMWSVILVSHSGQSFWSVILVSHSGQSFWSVILVILVSCQSSLRG